MKKSTLLIGGLVLCAAPAFADICADITANYSLRIQQLQSDTNAALATVTDPTEQAAIRQSLQMQLSQLTVEEGSALASAGCTTTAPPSQPPTNSGSGTGGTNPPGGTTTPPTTPPPSTTPTPPCTHGDGHGYGHHDGDRDQDRDGDCRNGSQCFEQLKAYGEQLKTQGLRGHDLTERVKARARELGCNFGRWRSSINRDHDGDEREHGHRDCDRD